MSGLISKKAFLFSFMMLFIISYVQITVHVKCFTLSLVECRFLVAMSLHKGTSPSCSPNKHCSQWAWTYLSYCLCGAKDAVALTLGLTSVLTWSVAEVPQIITNYREKSTEGLSLAFLMTWIVGYIISLSWWYISSSYHTWFDWSCIWGSWNFKVFYLLWFILTICTISTEQEKPQWNPCKPKGL